MRDFCILVFVLVFFSTCHAQDVEKAQNGVSDTVKKFDVYGQVFDDKDVISNDEMFTNYQGMVVGDTLTTKFSARVVDVCQVKGCWMTLQLEEGERAMVRFKDYGFFVPKNSIGKTVIVNGLAFVEEMSVADQRHYAKDAGASAEAIARINKPKRTFGFEADGVLLE